MKEKSKKEIKTKNSPPASLHIEADRCAAGLSVFVSGIIGVEDFSEETVSLKSHGGKVILSGKRLTMCIYENKTVQIAGRIEDIKLNYGKN